MQTDYYIESPSRAWPDDLPELYYDYGTPPSTANNLVCTPPQPPQPIPTRELLGYMGPQRPLSPAYATRSTFTNQFTGYDGVERYHKPAPFPQHGLLLTQPLTTFFSASPLPQTVSPAALTKQPVSNPQPTIELHQPRPSRRIPIISLDKLAAACDQSEAEASTNTSSLRSAPFSSSPTTLTSYHSTRPSFQTTYYYPREDRNPQFSRNEETLSCACGCMEYYSPVVPHGQF